MSRTRTSGSILAGFALAAVLGGCGLFRAADPRTTPHPAGDVVAGAPANLPPSFPVPPDAPRDRTFSVTGKNHYFFTSGSSVDELRTYYAKALEDAGYTVRKTHELPAGRIAIEFTRGGRVGLVTIAPSPPTAIDPALRLRGTYVDVLYELAPPPAPRLPTGPGA